MMALLISMAILSLWSLPEATGLALSMKVAPLWKMEPERKARRRGFSRILGTDDSGNGCIAGPIVVATCTLLKEESNAIEGVQDCKKLQKADVDRIYNIIVNNPDQYAFNTILATPNEIDETNIPQATKEAMKKSIESFVEQQEFDFSTTYSIVDGHKTPKLDIDVTCRPWVKGDAQVYTVALASIIAKYTHNKIMQEMHKEYPQYGFDSHRGYHTKEHILALHKHGPCPLHRKSAKPVKDRSTITTDSSDGNGEIEITRRDWMENTLAILVASGASLSPRKVNAVYKDTKTGTLLPDVGEIATSIPTDWSGVDNPFEDSDSSLFSRLDKTSDSLFYSDPRFVEHVDENAVQRMTEYISDSALQPGDSVLDLCSSWTSHIRSDAIDKLALKRISGLGMNEKELTSNSALTEWTVCDLNQSPKLPYKDGSFSVVFCQLSIDYLTKPLEVVREVGRVLQPGGRFHVIFSNRLFIQKAVAVWTGADDIDHAYTVGCYLHFSNAGFEAIKAQDLSSRKGNKIVGDPLYVVSATKAIP